MLCYSVGNKRSWTQGFTDFLATVLVVAHWIDVQNFRTAYPVCLFVRRLHMGSQNNPCVNSELNDL